MSPKIILHSHTSDGIKSMFPGNCVNNSFRKAEHEHTEKFKYEGQVATTLREMGNKNMSDTRKNNQTTLSMSRNKKQEKSLHPPWHSYNTIFSSKDIQTTHA